MQMPKLVRFLLVHAALGFGLAIAFTAVLLTYDVSGLARLIARDRAGWLAVSVLTFVLGLTFGSLQMGAAVMLSHRGGEDGHPGPGTGLRSIASLFLAPQRVPARVKARAHRPL